MSERIQKVNALLASEVGKALGTLGSPGTLATVTAVETAADLRQATVWISTLPDDPEAWPAIEALRPALQEHVAARLTLKHTPKLTLAHDHGQAHAAHIDRLLEGR